jgi:outer membrane protein OmpA-like peptidoglycan-associated protein/tetratricopeptide (TPR) repeat protein
VRTKIILITLSLIPWIGLSQYTKEEVEDMTKKAKESQLVVEATRMLQEDYYYFSEIVVDKLLTLRPESSNYNYRKGFIILNSRNDFENAMKYLEKAVVNVKNNYDMYSAKETNAPSDSYYHLARCYHLDYQLDKAIEYYNLFIKNSSKKSELIDKAKLGITQCEVAKELIKTPKSAKVKNLDKPINTEYPEYSPVVSFDGKSLYYTSRRPWENGETESFRDPKLYQYPEDIYLSTLLGNSQWSEGKRLEFCVDNVNEATISVSLDEKRIYAYQDVSGNGDIFQSEFKDNKFQILEILEQKGINTDFWETHCTVTPDGNNIYFVSERPGGYGGRDIYRIVRMMDGSWSEPINLGPKINTKYDEDSPFLAIDNKTMYFASNGPKSIGGFDIFVTVRDEDNNWSEPINLGVPINSTGDDIFYTTTIDGLRGYITSQRKGGFGEKDIYEIDNDYMGVQNVAVLTGTMHVLGNAEITDETHVLLTCSNCLEKNVRIPVRQRDGAFVQVLEKCKDYEITYMKNNSEVIKSEKFNTTCHKKYEEINKEVWIADYDLTGAVRDRETNLPIEGVKVDIYNKADGKLLESLTTNAEGRFASTLLDDKFYGDVIDYEFKFSAPKYLTISSELRDTLKENINFEKNLFMDINKAGLDVGKVLELNPIYFDLDKYDIRPDAEIELNKIVKIMNENSTMKIELGSHTDCRASAAYNLKLSDLRAKASAEYIRKRITNPKRIYGKGYGESKLINDCACEGEVESPCSEEEHALNRRTEFRIVK